MTPEGDAAVPSQSHRHAHVGARAGAAAAAAAVGVGVTEVVKAAFVVERKRAVHEASDPTEGDAWPPPFSDEAQVCWERVCLMTGALAYAATTLRAQTAGLHGRRPWWGGVGGPQLGWRVGWRGRGGPVCIYLGVCMVRDVYSEYTNVLCIMTVIEGTVHCDIVNFDAL